MRSVVASTVQSPWKMRELSLEINYEIMDVSMLNLAACLKAAKLPLKNYQTQNENSVIVYSPSCQIKLSFIDTANIVNEYNYLSLWENIGNANYLYLLPNSVWTIMLWSTVSYLNDKKWTCSRNWIWKTLPEFIMEFQFWWTMPLNYAFLFFFPICSNFEGALESAS